MLYIFGSDAVIIGLIPTSAQIPQALLPRVAQFNKCSQVRRHRGEPLTSNDDNNCDNDINDNDCDSDNNNDITVITMIMIRCGS